MLSIENNQLRVEIDELGAQITHAIDKINNFDFIWNGNEWERHAPILFPAIGRSNQDKYLLDGRSYEMKQHGFARDYPWTVVDKGDDRVSLTLTENEETLKVYPFSFSLMVTYSLIGNQIQIKFTLNNNSERVMPFALGFHPGFNLPIGEDQLQFSDYELEFTPKVQELTKFVIDPAPFRSGKTASLANFKDGKLPLNYDEFNDDVIIIENLGLTQAKLFSSKSKHEILMDLGDFQRLALWTKPKVQAKFLCMELFSGLPDQKASQLTDWYHKEGNQEIAPGESATFAATVTLK